LKEGLKSYAGKQLKKGEWCTVLEINADGDAWIDHLEFGKQVIKREDFGQLEVAAVVAWLLQVL